MFLNAYARRSYREKHDNIVYGTPDENVSEKYKINMIIIEDPLATRTEGYLKKTAGTADQFKELRNQIFLYDLNGEHTGETVRTILSEYIDMSSSVDKEIRENKDAFLDTVCDGTLKGIVRCIATIKAEGLWVSICDRDREGGVEA